VCNLAHVTKTNKNIKKTETNKRQCPLISVQAQDPRRLSSQKEGTRYVSSRPP